MSYVPLWIKSNFSFLEGASHPAELVDRAADLGLKCLAITDRNGLYGVVRAFDRARERGIGLIIGAQVSWGDQADLVLLAQNHEGYANLCSLLSKGHYGQPKGQFELDWSTVSSRLGGLLALWHPQTPLIPDSNLKWLKRHFGAHIYALVCRHRWFSDSALEAYTLNMAQRFDLPLVASTEILYHDSGRQELHDVVTCIRHAVRLCDAGKHLRPNANHALKNPQEFAHLYADHPEWVARTIEVANLCTFNLAELEYRYPDEAVPIGHSTATWLSELAFRGAKKRYPNLIPQKVHQQLSKELTLIEELRYAGYFLTMWEIVEFCRNQEILCQGRGSAANSVVCYCLGITAVDPVSMDLLFERFLSRERAEPPDIDLDIEHNRREEVIRWMYERYGRERAAMVANVIRYRSRSAIREVGKVMGIQQVDLDRASKLVSHNEEGISGAIRDVIDGPIAHRLSRLASELQDFPRHLGIHPGGFLLGSEALDRIVPVEPATMPGRTVIQWDKTDVETMGLFKCDLLGLGALTHLDYAFRLLRKHRRTQLSMATIPAGDPDTYAMISRGDTVGVFQLESRAQMAMLPRIKPIKYYDIVVSISLVRPGPISGGMVHPYLRRRAGEEPVVYPHPSLESVLGKTLGVPLFQEQVMKLAVVAADYSPGEADQLRRDMAAWHQSGRIEQHRQTLLDRMVTKGIEREFAERVFDQIKGFGEYGFPESHAASFALIAYATAWIRCHHPEVFTCALLNAWPMGFYAPSTIIEDAKRHAVKFCPPDVTRSQWDCTLEPSQQVGNLMVRIGLRYVQGVSRKDIESILTTVRARPISSLDELKAAVQVSRDTWERLAVSGALSRFESSRRQALWDVMDESSAVPLAETESPKVHFPTLSARQLVAWDYDSMRQSIANHIVAPLRPALHRQGYAPVVAVHHAEPGVSKRCAGLVICRQMPTNAHGVLFVSLEDETGILNLIVWKKIWDRYRKVLLTAPLLGVRGRVQSEHGVVHLIAEAFGEPEFPGPKAILMRQKSHDFG